MLLDDFDTADAPAAREVVRVWADVPWWVDALVGARPYGQPALLRDAADRLAREWSPEDVDGALAHHPRIGDRPEGTGAGAEASRREQSASAGADPSTAAELRAGNLAYERRFGRVFLIRAAGRDADEILRELRRRLDNDPETESREVARQLREIALLRLDATLAEPADSVR